VRRLHVAFVSCCLGIALPAVAHATPHSFTGTLTITVVQTLFAEIDLVQVQGAGTADVTGSTVMLSAGVFDVMATPLLQEDVFFDSVRLSFANLAGSFMSGAGLGGGFGGSLAFAGSAVFAPVSTFLEDPFGGGNVSVPVGGVGRVGNTGADTLMNPQGMLTLKIGGTKWTTNRISPSGYLAYFDTFDGYITTAYPTTVSTSTTGADYTIDNERHLYLVTPISMQRKVAAPKPALEPERARLCAPRAGDRPAGAVAGRAAPLGRGNAARPRPLARAPRLGLCGDYLPRSRARRPFDFFRSASIRRSSRNPSTESGAI
jgi:hypothetical protein